MVWCAATLWASTAEGRERRQWEGELHRRGIAAPAPSTTSSFSPPPPPRSVSAPLGEGFSSDGDHGGGDDGRARQARHAAAVLRRERAQRNVRLRNLAQHAHESPAAARLPSPSRGAATAISTYDPRNWLNTPTSRACPLPKGPAHDARTAGTMGRRRRQQQQHGERAASASRSPRRGDETGVDDGRDPHFGAAESEATGAPRRSPRAMAPAAHGEAAVDERRVRPMDVAAIAVAAAAVKMERLERTAAEHEHRRATHLSSVRAHLHEENAKRVAHTRDVVRRHEAQIRAKEDAARRAIHLRELRSKDVIDQCETFEAHQTLLAQSHATLLQHAHVVRSVAQIMRRHQMALRLRTLFVPVVRFRLAKARRCARVAAGVWRGYVSCPSVDELRSQIAGLVDWPAPHIQDLINGMRRFAFAAGEVMVHQQEPATCCFLLTRGKVLIQQQQQQHHQGGGGGVARRRLHVTELGVRGAGYAHAEDLLSKPTVSRHFLRLVAAENVFGYTVSRAHFLRLSSALPAARTTLHRGLAASGAHRPEEAHAAEVPPAIASRSAITLLPSQLRESRCFTFWRDEELVALLAAAELVSYDRNEIIYELGERARCVFVVWKGTVKLLAPMQPPSVSKAPAHVSGGGDTGTNAIAASRASGKGRARHMRPQLSGPSAVAGAAGGGADHHDTSESCAGSPRDARSLPLSHAGAVRAAAPGGKSGGCVPNTVDTGLMQTLHLPSLPASASPDGGSDDARAAMPIQHLLFNPTRRHEMVLSFANVGQAFGEEGVIFNSFRYDTAVAATECAVYRLPSVPVIDGLLLSPAAFVALRAQLNYQRALRHVLRPTASELARFMPPQVAASFLRCMTALVVSCGEQLPLNDSIVFLQCGKLRVCQGDRVLVHTAPCLVAPPDAVGSIIHQHSYLLATGELHAFDAEIAPATAAAAPVVPPMTSAGNASGDRMSTSQATTAVTTTTTTGATTSRSTGHPTSGRAAACSLPTIRRAPNAAGGGGGGGPFATASPEDAAGVPIGLPGIAISNRALTRCDAWCVKTVQLLKRLRNVQRPGDLFFAAAANTVISDTALT